MRTDSTYLLRAAKLFDERIGLKNEASFRPRLARALRDVAYELGVGVEELVDRLPADASVFDAVLVRVTVQESGFFRHPEQFETLARVLMPTLSGPVNAWSAACANGQEAYSLAMVMNEAGRSGTVFASDVSPAALERTAAGSYKAREMNGVSDERRRRHFIPVGGGWQVKPELRRMITTQRHNLVDSIPARVSTCRVVMCRNVLIYLDHRHARLFLERLADAMDSSACLFIGAAETLWQMTDRFEPAQVGVSYVYRPAPSGSRLRTEKAPVPSAVLAPELPQQLPRRPPMMADQSPRHVDVTAQHYERMGRGLLADGSLPSAVVAFRQWAYLSSDDPAAHFQLGSTLDAAGDSVAASRAYRAALAALDRCSPEQLVDSLHGYNPAELRRLLVDRCGATSAQVRR